MVIKMKVLKTILVTLIKIIIVFALVLWAGTAIFDFVSVKQSALPKFCILLDTYLDNNGKEGTKEYLGLGYKVIAFNRSESLPEDSSIVIENGSVTDAKDISRDNYNEFHFGSWLMTYNSILMDRLNSEEIKNLTFKKEYTVFKKLGKSDIRYNYYIVEEDPDELPVVIRTERKHELEENTIYEFSFKGNTYEGSSYSIPEIFNNFPVTNIELIKKVSNTNSEDGTEIDVILYPTFYATIEKITNKIILVKGLDINDINNRGEYEITVKDSTILEWRGTKINLSNLKVGNIVSITHSGEILDISPGKIVNTFRIQLLDDEI